MVAKTRLVVRRAARTDVNKIGVYIGDRNLEAGLQFFVAAKEAFERSHTSRNGSLRQSRNKRLRDVRSWPISGFENYLVFYRPIDEGGIEVMRVLHGSQDVDRIIARG